MSGVPVVTFTCVVLLISTRGPGCSAHPAFPAPSPSFEGDLRQSSGALPRRGNAESRPQGCLTSKSDRQDSSSGERRTPLPRHARACRGIHVLLTTALAEAGQRPSMTMKDGLVPASRCGEVESSRYLAFNMAIDTPAGPSSSSCPRLSRASTSYLLPRKLKHVDGRDNARP